MWVAVLLSTYNGEKYIREQLDSVLKQIGSFKMDVWVRDDGSTDGTQAILEEYEKNGKIKWYTGCNLGPAFSFLNLVKRCIGYDFYAFADQDDYWLPDKIQSGINMIQSLEVPALYCSNAELVNTQLRGLGRNVYRQPPRLDFYTLTCAGGILGCTMVFNNMLAEMVQKHPLPQKIIMHDSYMAMICASVDGILVYDKNAQLKYRQHGDNVVGVSHGLWATLKERIGAIIRCPAVSIADQAESIIAILSNEMSAEKMNWLKKVSEYKNSYRSRMCLAFSRKMKYISKNIAFKLRLSILFGNR